MAFLVQQHIVHRDLAARNCLVASDYTVKVCDGKIGLGASMTFLPSSSLQVADFGRSRCTGYYHQYIKTSKDEQMPVRWLPPESLTKGFYSHASDVW
jgi:serine/threonine protein kinase